MNILVNITSDKKDLVKAGNAVKGFKDVIGEKIKMTGLIIYEKEELDEKTGEVKKAIVSCVKMENGEFITSISPTVKNSLQLIANTYDADEIKAGVDVMIMSKKSNSNRDFLYLDLV